MATITVRNFSIYGQDGRKYDFATKGTLKFTNNGAQLIGDGKWLGKSKGVPTSTFSCDNIISVGGNESTKMAAEAVRSQDYLDMSFGIIDGKIYTATMSADDVTFETDMEQGTLTGSFSFSGGEVETIG
jgi:hypothetical protein